MLKIVKLEVFGFQGGATYELGEEDVEYIGSLSSTTGYFVRYKNNETLYITGYFQFVATEIYVEETK